MKNVLTILAGVTLLGLSSCACAATVTGIFDFGEIANGNEFGATSMVFTDNSISITATAADDYFVYLDHDSNDNAGLGVCQSLNGNQCNPSSDDNVTYGETLILNFGEVVKLDSLIFRNGNHGDVFAEDATVTISGGIGSGTFALILSSGSVFEFYNPNAGGDSDVSNNYQFYINELSATATGRGISEVPVPAAVWLFGSGLIGLVGVARRKA